VQKETHNQTGDREVLSGMVQTAIDPQDFSGLRARRQVLDAYWQQGISGYTLLRKHSDFIDHHLVQGFERAAGEAEGFALVALGGYGRQELYPFSDIDLMLLYDPAWEEDLNSLAEAVLYPLWDSGLEVGHAVRTPEECLADADSDFFFRVARCTKQLLLKASARSFLIICSCSGPNGKPSTAGMPTS
jgi:UTP:GlnB (protein PII) uridylyltransferase